MSKRKICVVTGARAEYEALKAEIAILRRQAQPSASDEEMA